MGRDTLSTTALARQLVEKLTPLSELLSPNERRIVEKFFETILQQRFAIANATDLLPLEAALVVLIMEEHRRNNQQNEELYQELHRQIDALKEEIQVLSLAIKIPE